MPTAPFLPTLAPAVIARLDAFVYRVPAVPPVQTSFGTMHDRPALFVRVTDRDGAVGWGEVWCNFPACGAEHRARLVESVFRNLVVGRNVTDPRAIWKDLSARTEVLAIQSGEHGPMAQVIAGIDLALWDLMAQRAGLPLFRLLGGTDPRIGVYASGINPKGAVELAMSARKTGYTAFKLKVGFDLERDLVNLNDLRAALGDDARLMADANQAWGLDQAVASCQRMANAGLSWIEEPLRADQPLDIWRTLRDQITIPIAAGENMAGNGTFDVALDSEVYRFLQPDVAKWGGISGCWPVAQRIVDSGTTTYCPHYLGAGVGLAASAHLLAAVGGRGSLEIDANPNLLRSALTDNIFLIQEGCVTLPETPGIGIAPDTTALREFQAT